MFETQTTKIIYIEWKQCIPFKNNLMEINEICPCYFSQIRNINIFPALADIFHATHIQWSFCTFRKSIIILHDNMAEGGVMRYAKPRLTEQSPSVQGHFT